MEFPFPEGLKSRGLELDFAYLSLLCLGFVTFKGPLMVIFNSGAGIQCCNPYLDGEKGEGERVNRIPNRPLEMQSWPLFPEF